MGNRAAEIVVLVCGDDVAGFVYVLRDVAVVVVGGEVEQAIARDCKEAADAAHTLKRISEIESPEVLYLCDVGCAAIDGVDGFVNQIPIVIDEGSLLHGFPHFLRWRGRRRCGRNVESLHGLRRPASAVVVCVADADRTIGEECRGDGGQLVFRVVGVEPRAVGDETAIGSVGE